MCTSTFLVGGVEITPLKFGVLLAEEPKHVHHEFGEQAGYPLA